MGKPTIKIYHLPIYVGGDADRCLVVAKIRKRTKQKKNKLRGP
jgi:hypothetical protein